MTHVVPTVRLWAGFVTLLEHFAGFPLNFYAFLDNFFIFCSFWHLILGMYAHIFHISRLFRTFMGVLWAIYTHFEHIKGKRRETLRKAAWNCCFCTQKHQFQAVLLWFCSLLLIFPHFQAFLSIFEVFWAVSSHFQQFSAIFKRFSAFFTQFRWFLVILRRISPFSS